MRLLIDECIDQRLRLLFPNHDCRTAGFAKLAGLKNGRLLDAAEAAGFNVLITVDQPFGENHIHSDTLRTDKQAERPRAPRAFRDFGAGVNRSGTGLENQITGRTNPV